MRDLDLNSVAFWIHTTIRINVLSWLKEQCLLLWSQLVGLFSSKSIMANKTSQEETAVREQAASKDDTEKESKTNGEQSPSGNKPLAAKSGYYYAHSQVPFVLIFIVFVLFGGSPVPSHATALEAESRNMPKEIFMRRRR